jgi:arylsulfatase
MSNDPAANSKQKGDHLARTARFFIFLVALVLLSATAAVPANAQAPQQRPNILFILGDDIGWLNI